MRRPVTPSLGRRSLILGAASLLSGPRAPLVLGTSAFAAAPAKVLTPAQTFGPFYPVEWTGDADNDLVQVTGEDRSALGTIMHITGRVLDAGGNAIAGAAIEIWQCDGHGIYRHPRDTGFFRKNDKAFQGALRDTVLIPSGEKVSVEFDADNRGTWAFHCHHLYHMNSGMMAAMAYV